MIRAGYYARNAAIFVVWNCCNLLSAAPYGPEGMPIEWTQSNGEKIQLNVYGDEFFARTETLDGYTVVHDPSTGDYHYAERSVDGKKLKLSMRKAHQSAPRGLPRRLEMPDEKRRKIIADRRLALRSPEREQRWQKRVMNARQKANRHRGPRIFDNRDQPQPSNGEGTDDEGAGSPADTDAPGAPVNVPPVVEGVSGLTILVQFPDDPATTVFDPVNFPVNEERISALCNAEGYNEDGNSGSVRDYFYHQSNGALNYTQIVVPIITLPHPRNHYTYSDYPANTVTRSMGPALRLLIADAGPSIAASGVDFSGLSLHSNRDVRAFNLLWAGPTSGIWTEGLWPHKWLMSNRINIGTAENPIYLSEYASSHMNSATPAIGSFVHENGHLILDLPDLYDLDSVGENDGPSNGVGRYCLMGLGGSNNSSRTPAPINLHFRDILGWAEMEELSPDAVASRVLSSSGNRGVRIRKPGSDNESFVIENLSAAGNPWTAGLPDNGVAIWHVDEAKSGQGGNNQQQMTEEEHYYVSLQQADGMFDLENNVNGGDSRDLYDLLSRSFKDGTVPDARWWDGSPSGLDLQAISLAGAGMSVRFNLPEVQILAQWTPTATPKGVGALHPYHAVNEPNPEPDQVTPGVQVTVADRVGPGGNTSDATAFWPGWASAETALPDNRNYTQFSVNPIPGGDVSYAYLSYSYFGDATSAVPYRVYLRTSIDGFFSNTTPEQSITTSSGTLAFDLSSVEGLQECAGTVTFRIYAERIGNSSGSFFLRATGGGMRLGGIVRRPPAFAAGIIDGGRVEATIPYQGNITPSATDTDQVGGLTFNKVSGASWLQVSPDGSLFGTPPRAAQELNAFQVRVTDSRGLFSECELEIRVIPVEADLITLAQWIPTATPVGGEATHPYHSIAAPNPLPTTSAEGLQTSEADRVGGTNASISNATWPGRAAAADDGTNGAIYTEFTSAPVAGRYASYGFFSYAYLAHQASPATPYRVYLRSSLDGFQSDTVPPVTFTAISGTVVFDLRAVGDLQSRSQAVTFRLYAERAGADQGWFSLRSADGGMHLRGQVHDLALPAQPEPYDEWRLLHFQSEADNPVIAGDLSDPNLDGVPNLVSYAMGVNPVNPPAEGTTGAQRGKPEIVMSGGGVEMIYQQATDASDVSLEIETSQILDDPDSWQDANMEKEIIRDEDGIMTIRATYLPHSGEFQRFYRFKATR